MEWKLNTVLDVYHLIESGRKSVDTRAPERAFRKRYDLIVSGDKAVIAAVDDRFQRLQLPELVYEVGEVNYFMPVAFIDKPEDVLRRMFESISVERVFPGLSIDEAIERYNQWPSTARIAKNGIVAFELNKRL